MQDAEDANLGAEGLPVWIVLEKIKKHSCAVSAADMPWPVSAEQEKEKARREDEHQIRLAGSSSRGKKIDLDNGHLIPLETPSAVVDAIRHVAFGARGMR